MPGGTYASSLPSPLVAKVPTFGFAVLVFFCESRLSIFYRNSYQFYCNTYLLLLDSSPAFSFSFFHVDWVEVVEDYPLHHPRHVNHQRPSSQVHDPFVFSDLCARIARYCLGFSSSDLTHVCDFSKWDSCEREGHWTVCTSSQIDTRRHLLVRDVF